MFHYLQRQEKLKDQFNLAYIVLRAQASVAFTNHFALMANGAWVNYTSLNNKTQYQNLNLYEGAIGYYTKTKNKSNPIYFEAFLGYGQGEGSFRDNTDVKDNTINDSEQKGKYVRYIFQPTLGLGFDKGRFQLAFTPRISYVDFSALTTTIVDYSRYIPTSITTTTKNPDPVIFIEPAITAKFNFANNRIFVICQTGLCFPGKGNDYVNSDNTDITWFPFNFSTGVGLRFGGVRWHKREE